jgi:3-oxoacyl-[acyl-carrier protein] reductase
LGSADKAFLVTGATSGLGLATARAVLEEGARVLVSARAPESVEKAVAELGAGDRLHGVTADNGVPAAADHLVGAVLER